MGYWDRFATAQQRDPPEFSMSLLIVSESHDNANLDRDEGG